MLKILRNRKGQGLVEYALIVATVVAIIIAVQTKLKAPVTGAFNKASTQINAAVAAAV